MKLTCIHCGQDFAITSEQLGGRGRCPHCTQVVEFPRGNSGENGEERRQPKNWIDNSISGLGSIAIHLILLILIGVVLGAVGAVAGSAGVWISNLGSMVISGIWSVMIARSTVSRLVLRQT